MTQEKKSRSWAFRCEAFKNSLSVSVVCRDCSLLLNTDPPRWWFEKVRFPCKALTISLKWRFLACFQQGTQLRGSASIQRRWSWLMGVGSGPGFYQHQTLKWGLGALGFFTANRELCTRLLQLQGNPWLGQMQISDNGKFILKIMWWLGKRTSFDLCWNQWRPNQVGGSWHESCASFSVHLFVGRWAGRHDRAPKTSS